jgi:hypothetical protein
VSLAQEDGEGTAEEGMHTFIDDSKLAEAHTKKEEEEKEKKKGKTNEQQPQQEEEEEKKSEEGEGHENGKKGSKGEKDQKKGKKEQETTKKEDDKKAAKTKKESKKQKQKKKREEDEERGVEKRGDDGDDNKKEEGKEAIARKLYGDKVHFVTTDPALAQKLRGLDCVPVVDGVISGVTGTAAFTTRTRHAHDTHTTRRNATRHEPQLIVECVQVRSWRRPRWWTRR